MKPEENAPSDFLSEETEIAARELVSKALRENRHPLIIRLTLTDEGQPAGRYQVTVQKLD